MPNFFTKHIFLYDPQQKNTDHFKILSVKPSKLQKQSVFWPQTSSEANIEAAIEAGRVNLVKKHSHGQRGRFWPLQRPWPHPSAADSDQIWGFENCSGFGRCGSIWTFSKVFGYIFKPSFILEANKGPASRPQFNSNLEIKFQKYLNKNSPKTGYRLHSKFKWEAKSPG